MKTTRQQAIDWWNSLGKTKRTDLSLDYYGCTLLMDSEVEAMWIKEVPEEKIYSEQEIRTLCLDAFNLGMDFRMRRLNGNDKITVEEVLNNFFENKLK